ncbi:MAG: hypothetical protein U0Z26_10195 [Anaerolineales bacterium]
MNINLASSKVNEVVENARQLKAPGQQKFPEAVDAWLTLAIEAAERGENDKVKSQLEKAVAWAKEHRFL